MLEKLFDELKLTGDLPSPSGVGLTIMQLTQGDDFTLDDVSNALTADPTLTSRIIQLANSSMNSGVEPASTVGEASLRLGLRTVRSVALGFTLVSGNRDGKCEAFDYERFWAHSLAVAVASQVIALEQPKVVPGEAFTLGLLSGMGRLALASVHPEQYALIIARVRGGDAQALAAAEESEFGLHNGEMTVAMLADWNLPEYFGAAVECLWDDEARRNAKGPQASAMAGVLASARDLARSMTVGARMTGLVASQRLTELEACRTRLGLDEAGFEALWDSVVREWRNWGSIMKIETPVAPRLAAIRTAAESFDPSEVEAPFEGAQEPRAAIPASQPAGGEANRPLSARSAADGSESLQRPLRVLVAEDETVLRKLISFHLTRAGHEVEVTAKGGSTLEACVRFQPDLVIVDWSRVEEEELDIVRALRSSTFGQGVQIIVLTARDDESHVVQAFEAGADEYLNKPFNPKILVARVSAAQRFVRMRIQIEHDKREREHQMAQLAVLNRRLHAAALTDPLTELPNRRYAMQRLQQELARAQRQGSPLSVVMVDIDKFKSVNDEHGHDIGDVVLKETARVLRGESRKEEVVCRLGGEEFLIICSNADLGVAAKCADRLRRAVEAHHITAGTFDRNVTISMGAAELDSSAPNVDALIKVADERVYEAKESGRNCVRAGGLESELNLAS